MDEGTLNSIVVGLRAYQEQAMMTAVYGEQAKIVYPLAGLVSEVGELSDILKRVLMDDGGNMGPESNIKMRTELGDCLWHIAAITRDLGADLGSIGAGNLLKLHKRMEHNTIRTREGR